MTLVYLPHLGASIALQSGTLSGNTSGASTFFGSNVVLAGGSNVTLQASSDTVYIHGASGGGGGSGAGTDWAITGGSITVNTSGGTISLPAYLTTAAPPGAYLTTAAQSDHSHGALSLVNLTGTSASNGLTLSAAAPGGGAAIMVSAGTTSGNVQTLRFQDSNGVSFGLNGSTVTASHDGLTTTPRLDEIRNPTADALFAMNTRQVQFQWGTNWTTWTTAPSRVGLFEIDVGGNYTGTDHVDVLHIHQSVSDPVLHMIHVEAGGTNATGIHLEISGPVAIELNRPLSYDGGTVPMILGTSQSNVVSNLNAFYLEGARSIQFQSTGAYLTTAAQVSHSHGNPTLALTNLTGTTASASNGLTLSLSGNAAQTVQPAVGLNTALTANGVSWTINSSGLSLNVPAFLTTAAGVSHTHGAGPTLTGPVAATSASNGLSLNVNAIGNTTAATNVTWTVGTNGLSLNAGGYAGTGTSGTNATFTLNSAGLALNAGAYLTTAAQVSHSHGNPTLALTNLTGTTASASNGFTLSLSAAAPGAGGGLTAIGNTASTNAFTSGGVIFSGLANITVNTSANGASQYIQISAPNPGGGAGVTLSRWDPCSYVTGSAYSSHAPASWFFQHLENDEARAISYIDVVKSFGVGVPAGTSSNVSQTFRLSYSHGFTIFSRQNYGAQSSNLTTCCTGSWGASISFQHSSSNSQSLDLRWVTDSTGGTAQTATNSAGNGWSARVVGPRVVRIPFVTTLAAGEYWIAHNHSTTAASTGATATTIMQVSNFHIVPQLLNSNLMLMGAGGTSSSVGHLWPAAQGVASAVTTNNSMAMSVISNLTVQNWYWNAGNI